MNLSRTISLHVFSSLLIVAGSLQVSAQDAGKTAAIDTRLRSLVQYNTNAYNRVFRDSSVFWYAGLRGSRYNYTTNTSYVPGRIYSGPSSDFIDLPFNAISYDSAFHPHVMFDQMDHYGEDQTTGNMQFWARETRGFLPDGSIANQLVEYTYPTRSQDGWRQAIAYEKGMPVKVYQVSVYPQRADTVGIRTLRYNHLKQLIFDSVAKRGTFVFTPIVRYRYSYEPSGRLESTEMVHWNTNDENRYYHYDSAGRVVSVYRYEPQQYRAEELRQIDSFEYQPGVYGYTRFLLMKYAYTNRWMYEKRESVVNTLSKGYLRDSMTTIVTNDTGKVTDVYGARFFYNAADLPDSSHHYTNFYGVYKKYAWHYYAYEQYNNGVGVAAITQPSRELMLIPNPSQGPVALEIPAALAGTVVTITLRDMGGRSVYSETLRLGRERHQIVLDARVPAGTYALIMHDQRGIPLGHARVTRL